METTNMTKAIKPFQTTRIAASAVLGCLCCLSFVANVAAQMPNQATGTTLSPFGIGVGPSDAALMASIGLQVSRVVDTSWDIIGTPDGKWKWEGLDRDMKNLADNHIEFGGWFYAAGWLNGKRNGNGLAVDKNHRILPGYANYVTEVVKHCKGKIKYWELFNEPPNGTEPYQTPADYALIAVTAYNAAKAADPDSLIGLATKSVHVNYLEKVIQAGAKDHFDYITVHPYEVAGLAVDHPGTESVYMHIVSTIRKMLAAQNPAKVNVPIIFTELGYMAKNNEDPIPGVALVKDYTMGIAQGVTCIHWFQGKDAGGNGAMGLVQANGTPRPAFTAMAQMIKHFGQHPTALGWLLLNDKHYGFVFQGDKGTVLVTWTAKGTDHLDFGKPVQIVNPLTGQITTSSTYDLTAAPTLILGVPDALVTQAKNNKVKPFPWDGDYTNAKSVSVTMGTKNVEKGLHTQSAESIAADVITYGGFARSGTVPGGTVFMVDPNFLSYTATPIEITFVVRRNAANEPATLDLEYESVNGYKRATKYEVPDNKGWHKATWKINDSQFVSTWGFNFRLEPGSYDLQSVTVTKAN